MAKKKKGNKKNKNIKSAGADGRATDEPLVEEPSSNRLLVDETLNNVDADELPAADDPSNEPNVRDDSHVEVQTAETDTINGELANVTKDISDNPDNRTTITIDPGAESPVVIHPDNKSESDQIISVEELTGVLVDFDAEHVEEEAQEVCTDHKASGGTRDVVEKSQIATDNTCVTNNSNLMLNQVDDAIKPDGGENGNGPDNLSAAQPATDNSNKNGSEETSSTPESSSKNSPTSEKSLLYTGGNNQMNIDPALSIREKLIEKDCQEWIVNAEDSIESTCVGKNDDASEVNKPHLELSNAFESGTTESFSDDSVKRKSSLEMEDVDLEDEAFSGSTTVNGSKITPAAKEAFGFLVAALRDRLGDDATNNVPDEILRQYICWKPDLNRAIDRYKAHDKFLKDNFNEKTLLLSVNPKVCYLLRNGLALAPEELIDKSGSAVMVIRAARCDFSPTHGCSEIEASRAIFFMIQLMLERKSLDTSIGGIVIVLDLVGCQRKNISSKLIKILGNAAGCFPIRIKAIYVVGMPWWFPSSSRKLFSPKLQERIHILKEKATLSEYIDEDRLLEEDGGIHNFDLHSWISAILSAEVGMKR